MELEKTTDMARARAIYVQKIKPWWTKIFKENTSLNEVLDVFTSYCLNSGRTTPNQLNSGYRVIKSEADMMSITEKFDMWENELLEKGRQEGQQEGLRISVKTLLAEKFGAAGTDFWNKELESLDIAPWQKILTQLLYVKSPQELQYKHL
jgi:hypothetical protein